MIWTVSYFFCRRGAAGPGSVASEKLCVVLCCVLLVVLCCLVCWCVVLCCVVLCYVVLSCVVLCCVVLVVLCCAGCVASMIVKMWKVVWLHECAAQGRCGWCRVRVRVKVQPKLLSDTIHHSHVPLPPPLPPPVSPPPCQALQMVTLQRGSGLQWSHRATTRAANEPSRSLKFHNHGL